MTVQLRSARAADEGQCHHYDYDDEEQGKKGGESGKAVEVGEQRLRVTKKDRYRHKNKHDPPHKEAACAQPASAGGGDGSGCGIAAEDDMPNLERYLRNALENLPGLKETVELTLHVFSSPFERVYRLFASPTEPRGGKPNYLGAGDADETTLRRRRLIVVGKMVDPPAETLSPNGPGKREAFLFAMYAHEFRTVRQPGVTPITTAYIEKVDTTGCASAAWTGTAHRNHPPLASTVVSAYIHFLDSTVPRLNRTAEDTPRARHYLHVFSRAAGQYLFPNSVNNEGKRARDGSSLLRWWICVVDAALRSCDVPGVVRRAARWFVPGAEEVDAARAVRLREILVGGGLDWIWGYPYLPNVPAFFSLPWFPDDAKCRQLEEGILVGPETTVAEFFLVLGGCCEFANETAGILAVELLGRPTGGAEADSSPSEPTRKDDELELHRMAECFLLGKDRDFGDLASSIVSSEACSTYWRQLGLGTHETVIVKRSRTQAAMAHSCSSASTYSNAGVIVVNDLQRLVKKRPAEPLRNLQALAKKSKP